MEKVKLRKQPPQRPDKPSIVCDIETRSIGRGANDETDFIIGAYLVGNEETVRFFHSPDEWLALILSHQYRGHIWYAHNGGEFDYKYLIPAIRRYMVDHVLQVQVIRQGQRVIGFVFRTHKHRYEIRDSYALIPTSLAKMTKSLSPEFVKKDLNFDTEDFDSANPQHIEYLRYDVLGLRAALTRFKSLIRELWQVNTGWTAPSTALKCWRSTLHQDYYRPRPDVDTFCRRAYYGGLVFIRDTRMHTDCVSIDVNSMYPFVMRKFGVPYGPATSTKSERVDRPGFYHCRVRARGIPFTFIPARLDGHLLWPLGIFDTYLSSVEIVQARTAGYEIDVLRGYVFDEIQFLFNDFVSQCEGLRIRHKGTAIEDVVKIMQNSVYGKFGSKPIVTEYALTEERGYQPVCGPDGLPSDVLFERETELDATYLQPHWSAWITAQARLYLTHMVYAIGPEHVLYGDTDSITMTRAGYARFCESGFGIGVQYGHVKVEKRWQAFIAGGPKNYAGILESGEYYGRAKGVPSRKIDYREQFRALQNNSAYSVNYFGANSTMRILKSDVPYFEMRHRSLSRIENSAGWLVGESGIVTPRNISAFG